MVATRYTLLALLTWLMSYALAFAADTGLRIEVMDKQVEYGRPIQVELFAQGHQIDLAALDLSALEADFTVDTPDTVVRDNETGQQHWRLRLYPRAPGELQIPSLELQGSKTAPVSLSIRPAMEGKQNSPLQVTSQVEHTEVWLRQAVEVSMLIESSNQYARVETEAGQHDAIDIRLLPRTRTSRQVEGEQRTLHRIGWVLYPRTPGTQRVQLPAIKYRGDTGTYRFYPPPIDLQVRPLPAFVPPTLPVGPIQLDIALPDDWFLARHELAFLKLHINSEAHPDQRPSALLRQFKSSEDVTFYAPRDSLEADENGARNISTHSYQLPFAIKTMGLVKLPAVRLQYFDPSTGKIETQSQAVGRILSLPQWLIYALSLSLLLVLYRLLQCLYYFSRNRYRAYCGYRTALHRFQQASTAQDIRDGLAAIAVAEGWPANLSLAMWLAHWQSRYPRICHLSENVRQLEDWLYGDSQPGLAEIQPAFIDVCYQAMPLLKIRRFLKQSNESR
ncbi:MAG TPA: hypothetical protein VIQ81_08450 [Gammaproteobacteria bacterium]